MLLNTLTQEPKALDYLGGKGEPKTETQKPRKSAKIPSDVRSRYETERGPKFKRVVAGEPLLQLGKLHTIYSKRHAVRENRAFEKQIKKFQLRLRYPGCFCKTRSDNISSFQAIDSVKIYW